MGNGHGLAPIQLCGGRGFGSAPPGPMEGGGRDRDLALSQPHRWKGQGLAPAWPSGGKGTWSSPVGVGEGRKRGHGPAPQEEGVVT